MHLQQYSMQSIKKADMTVYMTSLLYQKELVHPLVGSRPFAPDSPGQLDVLGHDGHPLGMDGLQAGNMFNACTISRN